MYRRLTDLLNVLFHPHDYFKILGRDRYKSLKIRIVLIDAVISLVPLFIVVTISYFWFQSILKEDFRNQVKWQIENTEQSIEYFIDEKVSALRFLASSYSYEQLSDQKMLTDIFSKFEKEFSGLVDLGLIDASGIQRSYAGPYPLTGKDYSNQEWFNEVVVRNVYVSDVFMGYRRLPHFAIAVKKDCPEKRTFCIIRATIDMKILKRFASDINLRENDDVFIINHEGILQTPSRFHGDVLNKFKLPVLAPQRGVSVADVKEFAGGPAIFGYVPIKNSRWILAAVIKSTPYSRIPKIFRNELFLISILSVLISVVVTFLMAQTVVDRIKKADQEIEDAMAKTEQASKLASIGRLAAGVAHEINNPLAIINEKAGLVKDLLEMSGDIKDKNKLLALFSGIFDSVTRCRTITHRLLGFARRMEITHEVIDLNDVIKEVIGFLEQEILFRKITLELNLMEDLPKIESDKGQLQQVLLNIINNAVDAVKKGDLITVSTNVKDRSTVVVSVRDTGPGIPKDKLKTIFEPFYTTKEKGKGTGLGLFISLGIMKRLGGTILVESQANKGTTFIVEIPIAAEFVEGGSA